MINGSSGTGQGRGQGGGRRRTRQGEDQHTHFGAPGRKRTDCLQSVLQNDVRTPGQTLEYRDSEDFGDILSETKAPTVTRVGFQNIGPQPRQKKNCKTQHNAEAVAYGGFDVTMVAEHCLNLSKLQSGQLWTDRMSMTIRGTYSAFGYNKTELCRAKWDQVGGSAVTVTKQLRAMKEAHGVDPTGLGRWSWIRVRGKHEQFVRFVSCYRPVPGGGGTGSAWSQHVRFYRSEGTQDPNPRTLVIEELCTAIRSWMDDGDHVVLGMDVNEDVRDGFCNNQLANIGMFEAIIRNHPTKSVPATCNKDRISRRPIDSIWASPGVDIVRCGFLPYHSYKGFDSDHRMVWVEIDNASILGHYPQCLAMPPAEKLRSNDPRYRELYNERVLVAFEEEDEILVQVEALMALMVRHRAGEDVKSLAQDCHRQLKETSIPLRKKIESKLRTFHTGPTPWSPRLQVYRDAINYWNRSLLLQSGYLTSRVTLKRLAAKIHIYEGYYASVAECITQLKKAHKAYKTAKKDAAKWRTGFQETFVTATAKRKAIPEEVVIRQIKREAESKRQGMVSRSIRERNNKQPVVRAIAIAEDGTKFEVDTQEGLIAAATPSFLKRQQQTEGTPFMTEPLLSEIGYLADGPAVDSIIDGRYIPPHGTDPYAREFLSALEMPASIRAKGPVNCIATLEEHRDGWKAQKARTASESSTLGFEHYKSAIFDSQLCQIDHLLRTVPLEIGFVPPSWLSITDVAILKKLGVLEIDLMRLIQLMDAEFQMNNKLLGKKALAHAELCDEVADEQHGSRKNHKAILCCLNKVLVADYFRLTRRSGCFGMNDAKGCFDRIVHSVAILVYMSFGVPALIVRTLFGTLQKASHKIKTGFGISEDVYGDEPVPLQGTGQGNGHAPTTWALISSKMFQVMKTAGHGLKAVTAISRKSVSLVGFAFVDDTDIIDGAEDVNTSGERILARFQSAMDRWCGVLRATGGLIAPEKSVFYLIDFDWTGTDYTYRNSINMPGNITLLDKNGDRVPLKRYEVSKAEQSLGVWIAMDGNWKEQLNVMKEKAQLFASQISTKKVSKNDALYTYNYSFMKTLEYPMTALSLTENEWNSVVMPALRATLTTAKMAKTFPRKVLYGPDLYQGLEIRHPYFLQQISKIMAHIQELASHTQTGDLLELVAEAFRVELGVPFTLGSVPSYRYGKYIPNCWYKSLWEFAQSQPIEIIEDFPTIPTLRKKDQFLMECFMTSGYSGADLKKLNYVRKYLKAVTLSDISTCDGKKVSHESFLATCSNGLRNDLDWPRVPSILPRSFITLWQRALCEIFIIPYATANNRTLISPLGPWTDPSVEAKWKWYYERDLNRVYQRRPDGMWNVYFGSGRRRGAATYRHDGLTEVLKPVSACFLVSMGIRGTTGTGFRYTCESESFWSVPISPRTADDKLKGPFPTLLSAVNASIADPRILLDSVLIPDDGGIAIAQGIRDGSARIVSDGSFQEDAPIGSSGTSGIHVHAGIATTDPCEAVNWVPGTASEQSAYRSELAGACGALAIVAIFVQFFKIEEGSVTLALDGESALKQCRGTWPLSVDQNSFDILQDIRARVASLPIKVNWKWVEGHQDDHACISNLDWWGRTNVRVDSLAKSYMRDCIHLHPTKKHKPQQLLFEKWALEIHGVKQSSVTRDALYVTLFGTRTLELWHKRDNLPLDPKEICWEESRLAIRRLPFGLRRWRGKFLTNCSGFALTLQTWQYQESSACPLCNLPEENRDHLLQCPDPRATEQFRKSIAPIPALLKKLETSPPLTDAIMDILRRFRAKRHITYRAFSLADGLRDAIKTQAKIGWFNFVLGRWTYKWKIVQQAHYQRIGSKKTAKRWLTAILHKLSLVCWDLWKFRNKVLHAPSGPLLVAQNHRLNQDIENEFADGTADLRKQDHSLFKKWTVQKLQRSDVHTKQQWLESVRLAREQYEAPEDAIIMENPLVRAMRQWLIHPPPNEESDTSGPES